MSDARTERARALSATSARGAAALITIDRPQRRNAVDGPTAEALHEAYLRFEADERGARAGVTGAGEHRLLRGRRPEGDRDVRRPADERRGADGLHAADAVQADDRRDLGLLPRGRPRDRAVVRPADRHRGLDARLSRAALGRAADRRRHPAAAADRRPGPRARPDPDRADDRRRSEALAIGMLTEVVAAGHAPASARSSWRRGSRASRSARCSPTAAPRSRASGCRSPTRLALEAAAGPEVFADGARGAARFAAGEGRGGAGQARRAAQRRRPTRRASEGQTSATQR